MHLSSPLTVRTTLALALRGARCSLWRSRSASVAWPWQAPARLSARVHECKGANRQKVFFVVVSCRVLWWVARDHRPLILIGGRWYIFVPFVFLFLYFCLSKLLFLFWYASKGIVHPYTPFTSQLFVKLSLFCECRSKGMVYLCGVPSVERMWKSVPLSGFFISVVLPKQNLGSK